MAGVRLALIRRPGRSDPARRLWAYADTRPGREQVWWGEFGDDAELVAVPLDGSAGAPSRDPVFLVCAHGRHDPCCAVRGRPVAAALGSRYATATWECSHVGGDRFAANLVVLPHGLYYGRLSPETALEVARAYGEGHVVPRWLRGRAALSPAAQAAQHHARLALGGAMPTDPRLITVDGLAPLHAVRHDERTTQVALAYGDERLDVTVHARMSAARELLTCGARAPSPMRLWDLVDLVRR